MSDIKHNAIQLAQDTLQAVQHFSPNIAIGGTATAAGAYYRVEIIHRSFDLAISIVTMVVLSVGSFLVKELLNHLKKKRLDKKRLKEQAEQQARQNKLNTII